MEYEDHLPAVIAMYRSLKDAGFNPESHSFQMEFGINQLDKKRPCLYQARIFRPFAPRADFDLRRADYGTGLGVTNKDGEKFSLHSLLYGENNNLKHPKAFYNHSAGQSLCLDFQPEHASAYAAPNALDILDHGDYRWIQKIPLFVNGRFEHGAPEVRELEQDGKEFDVRIKSNGQAASIEFLND